MICTQKVPYFCFEDISKIENYELAINDLKQTWDCHHRRETDEGLSKKELIELGLYYARPASELIFLTKAEHRRLHFLGEKHPAYGKPAYIRGRHKVWNDENNHSKGFHYEK